MPYNVLILTLLVLVHIHFTKFLLCILYDLYFVGLAKELEGLQKKTHNKVLSFADLLAARKKFEADVDRCQQWLNEAEVALSAEVRTANLELIQEQLNKVTIFSLT